MSVPILKDNTLYEESGELSNGAGPHFFSGSTGAFAFGADRRALIAFDLSAIPAGATIIDVTLTMTMDRTVSGSQDTTLHRVTSDWGEAGSVGGGSGGGGGGAETGDATWMYTFYDTDFWTISGGDFVTTASASQTVSGNGPYTWSGASMVADFQGWIDDPASNFGWIVIGNEMAQSTAKRFHSKEGTTPPELTVTYAFEEDIFADGFESGDTTVWSVTAPR